MNNKISFGATPKINWESVKRVMPEQAENLLNAETYLKYRESNDTVLLSAEKNDVNTPYVKMEIIPEGTSEVKDTFTLYDTRELGEISFNMHMEDYYKYRCGKVPDGFDREHEANMLKIQATKPNFGEIVLKFYDFSLFSRGKNK